MRSKTQVAWAPPNLIDFGHALRTAQFVLGALVPQRHGAPLVVGCGLVIHAYGSPDRRDPHSAWMFLAVNPVFANRGIGSELNRRCICDVRDSDGGLRGMMFTTVWDPLVERFLLRCDSPRKNRPHRRWEIDRSGALEGRPYKVLRYYHPGGNDRH